MSVFACMSLIYVWSGRLINVNSSLGCLVIVCLQGRFDNIVSRLILALIMLVVHYDDQNVGQCQGQPCSVDMFSGIHCNHASVHANSCKQITYVAFVSSALACFNQLAAEHCSSQVSDQLKSS